MDSSIEKSYYHLWCLLCPLINNRGSPSSLRVKVTPGGGEKREGRKKPPWEGCSIVGKKYGTELFKNGSRVPPEVFKPKKRRVVLGGA